MPLLASRRQGRGSRRRKGFEEGLQEGLAARKKVGLLVCAACRFVGVVCRSPSQLAEGKTPKEAQVDEEAFFRRHPKYQAIASRCGTRYLSKLLSKVQMGREQNTRPRTRHKAGGSVSASLDSTDCGIACVPLRRFCWLTSSSAFQD